LPINSNKLFFELIDAFMNSKLCFQSPTFKGFHESNWDVYSENNSTTCEKCVSYHNSSPCENLKFNEELNNEKSMERDASPFVAHDLMLHYARTLRRE